MEARFKESLQKGWKGECPCCGRHAQIYKRALHASVARQLIRLYMLGGFEGMYVHAARLIPEGQAGVGDLSKAKYFGLIRERPRVMGEAKKRSSGYWTLTRDGKAYVERSKMIPAYVEVFDDEVIAQSGDLVGIEHALGKAFSYQELMNDNLI